MSTRSSNGLSPLALVVVLVTVVVLAFVGVYGGRHQEKTPKTSFPPKDTTAAIFSSGSPSSFNYGFDLDAQGPDADSQDIQDAHNVETAVRSATRVVADYAGSMMDESLYGHGSDTDPEPTPGQYDLSSLAARISLITAARGIPVVTLINAPAWMHPSSSSFDAPPDPQFYQDYATLCAYVANSFPQVKYFVVWAELRHFAKNESGFAQYTDLYNDIYVAIKAVRPDAMVGGPYAAMSASSSPYPKTTSSTLHGSWGWINPAVQNAVVYWLSHKVGADFIAVDGKTEVAASNDPDLGDPATVSEQYAAVDTWIKSQTNLPIWWMESHIAPTSGWSEQEGTAARIATLVLMNCSGARVGMQWQPQTEVNPKTGQIAWPDEGLWTSVTHSGGGQETPLGIELLKILPILRQRLQQVPGQPHGVVLGKTAGRDSIVVNTSNSSVHVRIAGHSLSLAPFEIRADT